MQVISVQETDDVIFTIQKELQAPKVNVSFGDLHVTAPCSFADIGIDDGGRLNVALIDDPISRLLKRWDLCRDHAQRKDLFNAVTAHYPDKIFVTDEVEFAVEYSGSSMCVYEAGIKYSGSFDNLWHELDFGLDTMPNGGWEDEDGYKKYPQTFYIKDRATGKTLKRGKTLRSIFEACQKL